jgi:hypothetical protein
MKMYRVKIIAYIINFYSISAVAGYQCTIKMSDVSRPDQVVAAKMISIQDGIRSGSEGEILKGMDVDAYLNGQQMEEEVEIVLNKKDSSSDKISLKGTGTTTAWFEHYKVETSCQS